MTQDRGETDENGCKLMVEYSHAYTTQILVEITFYGKLSVQFHLYNHPLKKTQIA